MNKSWLEQQVQNEKLKKVQEEKKDGTIQKGLYRVRIKDKTGGICGKMISELLLLIRKMMQS